MSPQMPATGRNEVIGHFGIEERAAGKNKVASHSEIELEIEGANGDLSDVKFSIEE